jgi:hypothetical protein
MSGLSVDAYAIEAARDCICVEKEEGEAPAISTDYNANSLPSYFNLADEDLLGAAERSDSEADPCLLDTSSESMGSSRIARIEQYLAFLPGGGGHADDSLPAPTVRQDEKIKAPGHSGRCPRRGQSTR